MKEIFPAQKNSFRQSLAREDGQTFVEFILLFLVIFSLSLVLLGGINDTIGNRWTALVRIISGDGTVELR